MSYSLISLKYSRGGSEKKVRLKSRLVSPERTSRQESFRLTLSERNRRYWNWIIFIRQIFSHPPKDRSQSYSLWLSSPLWQYTNKMISPHFIKPVNFISYHVSNALPMSSNIRLASSFLQIFNSKVEQNVYQKDNFPRFDMVCHEPSWFTFTRKSWVEAFSAKVPNCLPQKCEKVFPLVIDFDVKYCS